MIYLILQHPGHNRVYYKTAASLALAELTIALQHLCIKCKEPEIVTLENIPYLSIETEALLTVKEVELLSRLSFVFALYRMEKQKDMSVLLPVRKASYEYLDPKISSILKYQGKTNELFTKMMINVAVLSTNFDPLNQLQLLDPVAGRGTTLFEGAVYGFDCYGIEIEPKSVQEATLFFKKYLEAERLKHKGSKRQLYGTSKANAVNIHEFTYAKTKEAFKAAKTTKTLGMVNGNSKEACNYFKNERFHIIVGDLPYGVLHGNTVAKKGASKSRNPSTFLSESLPQWYATLKTNGCIVVAWNTFLVSREKMTSLFEAVGFEVFSHPPYNAFEHRVDQSIKRDILVAKKV